MRLRILGLWAFSGLLVAGSHANEATIAAGAAIANHGASPGRAACSSCHMLNGAVVE